MGSPPPSPFPPRTPPLRRPGVDGAADLTHRQILIPPSILGPDHGDVLRVIRVDECRDATFPGSCGGEAAVSGLFPQWLGPAPAEVWPNRPEAECAIVPLPVGKPPASGEGLDRGTFGVSARAACLLDRQVHRGPPHEHIYS